MRLSMVAYARELRFAYAMLFYAMLMLMRHVCCALDDAYAIFEMLD